jgi:hypothetical protein
MAYSSFTLAKVKREFEIEVLEGKPLFAALEN